MDRMHTVVVNGAQTDLGRRVCRLARSEDHVRVVGIERDDSRSAAKAVATCDSLIVLAPVAAPERDGSSVGGVDLEMAARLLSMASGGSVRHVIVLSSAMVYGAWPDNPVPMTEDQPVHPNPGASFACDKAALEELVGQWATTRSEVGVAILRPTLIVSPEPEAVQWMGRSLWRTATARFGDQDPPRQFLHLDDLALAIDHARREQLRGVYNVAPDGWLAVTPQIELTGKSSSVRVPEGIAEGVAETGWRLQLTSTPPDVLPFTMYPWVVSNDRLRATGWEPTHSNEEAFIAGHRERWWSSLSARRRQEFSLAVMVAGLLATIGGAVIAVRRKVRR